MKNKMIASTILTSMLLMTTPVDAMGTAQVEFIANDNIQVGDTFTVSMSVTDIKDTYDGVVSMGGNLSFDSSMIEYVSSKGIETPYLFQINENANYKIAGLDFTLDNGIRNTLTVYEFTFKAIQEGNTVITLTNAKLTDSHSYIDTVVLEKEIKIEEKNEVIETPIISQEEIVVTNKVSINSVTKTEINEIQEEKTETLEKSEPIIEKNVILETKNIEEKPKEKFLDKIQKIINNLLSKFTDLFR